MASVLPSAMLEKMRPSEFFTPGRNEYFHHLEQMLIQIQDQIGIESGAISGLTSGQGMIDPLLIQALSGDDFTGATYVTASSNRTTQGSEIIRATASIDLTLRDTPEDGELVLIVSESSRVIISSNIEILGAVSEIGATHSSAIYRYHESSNQWVQLAASKKSPRFEKVVYSASDFDQPLRGDVKYLVDGNIMLGDTQLIIGSDGATIEGFGARRSSLSSTRTDAAIVSASGGCGDVELKEFQIDAPGGKVLDLSAVTAGETIEISGCNFFNCQSIGTLSGFRQLLGNVIGVFNCADGLECSGVWAGGAKLTDVLVRSAGASFYMFKAGAGLSFASRFFTDLNIDLPAGTTSGVADFGPENFNGSDLFQMNGAQVTRVGQIDTADSFYFPNISEKDNEAYFQDNVGIKNTTIGGYWQLTAEVVTTITGGNPSKLEGATTYEGLQHFTQTTDNAFVYSSDVAREVDVTAFLEIESRRNDSVTLQLRVWDDSEGVYVDHAGITKIITNYPGAGDYASYALVDRVSVDLNDRIELWVANNTSNQNATMRLGSVCRIKE